jgi:hypothetical protein
VRIVTSTFLRTKLWREAYVDIRPCMS